MFSSRFICVLHSLPPCILEFIIENKSYFVATFGKQHPNLQVLVLLLSSGCPGVVADTLGQPWSPILVSMMLRMKSVESLPKTLIGPGE